MLQPFQFVFQAAYLGLLIHDFLPEIKQYFSSDLDVLVMVDFQSVPIN